MGEAANEIRVDTLRSDLEDDSSAGHQCRTARRCAVKIPVARLDQLSRRVVSHPVDIRMECVNRGHHAVWRHPEDGAASRWTIDESRAIEVPVSG